MSRIKIIMLILLNIIAGKKFALNAKDFFKYVSIQQKGSFYFPVKDYFSPDYIPLSAEENQLSGFEKNLNLTSLKENFSTALVFSFGRFIYSTQLPKTQFTGFTMQELDIQNSWAFESECLKTNIPLSLNFMAGKINYSASFSRLKDNSFSSSNALKEKSRLDAGLCPYATTSLSAKNNSLYLQADWTFNKKSFLSLQMSCAENKDLFTSAIFKHDKINLSLSTAFVSLEKTSSSWKNKSPLFPQNNFLAMEAFFSAAWDFFYTSQAFVFTGQPLFFKNAFSLNSQNCFFYDQWTLWFNLNLSSPSLFTLEADYDTRPLQIQINPQKKWILEKNRILLCGILYQLNLNEPLYVNEKYYADHIIKTELKALSPLNSGTFKMNIKFSEDSSHLDTSLYLKTKAVALKPGAIFSASINKKNYSLYTKFASSINDVFKPEISFSKNAKWQSQASSNLSFGSTVIFNGKKLKVNAKILFIFSL